MLNGLGLGILLSTKDEFSVPMDKAHRTFNQVSKDADALTASVNKQEQAMKKMAEGAGKAMDGLSRDGAGRLRDVRGKFVGGSGGGGGGGIFGGGGAGTSAPMFEINAVQEQLNKLNGYARGALNTMMEMANVSGRFEQAIASVGAVSGATAQELDQLRESAIQAGIATQYSPIEATLGLRELAQAGYSAKESMALLLPVLNLAAGSLGELSPQAAAGLAAQTMKAFGIETDQAAITMDRMLQAVNVFALGAGELPLALGIASRGAMSMNATLSETLVSLGLVKNIIPTVERSSTAVATAMERMANPRAQKAIQGLGVAVLDSSGNFRQFLDILGDMAPKLDRMSQGAKAQFLLKTFGTEALAGVSAILTQVTNGIKDNTGASLTGGAAIAYLREQFEKAGGTAKTFSDKMLDTYAGQKKLLAGSMETMYIVIGDAFARAMRPLVETAIQAVNWIIETWQKLPKGFQDVIAKIALGIGVLVAAIAGLVALKVAWIAFSAAFAFLGVSFAGILAVAAPVIAVLAAVGLIIAALSVNAKEGGGVIGFFADAFGKVKLAFTGLMELFNQGGFSRATYDEMSKAENQGIMRFAIRVWHWIGVIQEFFGGLVDGFKAKITMLTPVFNALIGAFMMLGNALGLTDANAKDSADTWDMVGGSGKKVGDILAGVAGILIGALAGAIGAVAAVLQAMREAWQILGPIIMPVVRVIAGGLQIVFGLLSGDWSMAWRGAAKIVLGVVEAIIGVFGGFIRFLAKGVDAIASIFGGNLGLGDMVGRELDKAMAEYQRFTNEVTGSPVVANGGVAEVAKMNAMPGLMSTNADAASFAPAVAMSGIVAASQAPGPMNTSAAAEGRDQMSVNRPIETVANVNLYLDGERISRAQVRTRESREARAMSSNQYASEAP